MTLAQVNKLARRPNICAIVLQRLGQVRAGTETGGALQALADSRNCSSKSSTSWANAVWPWTIPIFLSLTACQTDGSAPPSLSLEEAKQVTSTFSGSLEAPPRTVNDILFQLEKIEYLRLNSRTSTLQYKVTKMTTPVIGSELGVKHIL